MSDSNRSQSGELPQNLFTPVSETLNKLIDKTDKLPRPQRILGFAVAAVLLLILPVVFLFSYSGGQENKIVWLVIIGLVGITIFTIIGHAFDIRKTSTNIKKYKDLEAERNRARENVLAEVENHGRYIENLLSHLEELLNMLQKSEPKPDTVVRQMRIVESLIIDAKKQQSLYDSDAQRMSKADRLRQESMDDVSILENLISKN